MVPYVCPRCRRPVSPSGEAYACGGCGARYPVVAGIPDFRVAPDPWIGLQEEREKALRLDEMTRDVPFEEAVRLYWSTTPGTPEERAARFTEHALAAEARSREWLWRLNGRRPPEGEAPWLDLGCGTADLAAAAADRGARAVAVDIALRWLVVARRRLALRGSSVRLVCCCAESLPFPDAAFGRVLSLGLLEHCRDPVRVLREARRVLQPGGSLRLRTVNRYSLLAEPHVGIWGVGLVPRRWADRYVRWRSGGRLRYLHHRPPSRRELGRSMQEAGFGQVRLEPARVLEAECGKLGRLGRVAARAYGRLREAPAARTVFGWVAPLLEAEGSRP